MILFLLPSGSRGRTKTRTTSKTSSSVRQEVGSAQHQSQREAHRTLKQCYPRGEGVHLKRPSSLTLGSRRIRLEIMDCMPLLEAEQIIDALLTLNSCARCVFRFLGIFSYDYYCADEEDLLEILYRIRLEVNPKVPDKLSTPQNSPTISRSLQTTENKPICVTCFDLLYYADTLQYVNHISGKLQSQNYETKDFDLIPTLPISLILRTHSTKIYIKKVLSEKNYEYKLLYPVDLVKVFKHLLTGSFEKTTGLTYSTESLLKIKIEYIHDGTRNSHLFLTKIPEANFSIKRIKGNKGQGGYSRKQIIDALKKVRDERYVEFDSCPPLEVKTRVKQLDPVIKHESVYMGGRYTKFSRNLPQTPWIINGVRLKEGSVAEIIGIKIKQLFRADDYTFVPSGREDFDVRMLGNGRPFYIELKNPRRAASSLFSQEISEVQNQINLADDAREIVRVYDLAMVKQSELHYIKQGEDNKTKTYSALVCISKQITPEILDSINKYKTTGLTINQKTPIRVLQRRTNMVRQRQIYEIEARALEGQFMVVGLVTAPGTYIKEFIHGDLGKTSPNLSSIIGCTADILELDVLNVDLEWPPPPISNTIATKNNDANTSDD
ncbi:12898_t:CDS:10 [Ambispora gerdemannii]|uniref:tRNA pseudouridine(55) synthase n=1 Tax=Ambispora gerdemannii TaxID=144530 RepID=A0A9N8UX40_9GLOM|nr:12898_t:CDS:10 [Ambispora gerdemannii]